MPMEFESHPEPAEVEESPKHPVAAKPTRKSQHNGGVPVFCTRLRNQIWCSSFPPNRLSTCDDLLSSYTVPPHHHHHHSKETSKGKDNGADEVTPEEQAALRAGIAKERKGKRGRPAAKSKSKPQKPLGRPKKPENPKGSKGDRSQQKRKGKGEVDKGPKKSPKDKGGKNLLGKKTRKRSEDLDEAGDNDETEPKVFGCSRCRYAKKGCVTCRNPLFRPRGPRASKSKWFLFVFLTWLAVSVSLWACDGLCLWTPGSVFASRYDRWCIISYYLIPIDFIISDFESCKTQSNSFQKILEWIQFSRVNLAYPWNHAEPVHDPK